jgi:long-chain acyl-CoA synthetase
MSKSPQNLATLFLDRAHSHGPDRGLLFRTESDWRAMTYGEWAGRSASIARGLFSLGVRPSDKVLVIAGTSVEFLLVSWAVAMTGGVLVPVSSALLAADLKALLKLVQPQFVFLQDPTHVERLLSELLAYRGRVAVLRTEAVAANSQPGRRPYLRLDDVVPDREAVVSLEQIESHGAKGRRIDLEELYGTRSGDDAAMIILTAGTMGEQKGVILTHNNLLYQARTLAGILPVDTNDVQLLFLPLSHILGVIAYLTSVASGTPLALGGGMRSLLEDLREVSPTFMVGVPRVYEKIVEKLQAGMAEFSMVWWQLYRRGLDAGHKVVEANGKGEKGDWFAMVQLETARRTVFQRCREIFGGQMRFLISGGAPLSDDTTATILSWGVSILNGFGLTETSGATHLNSLERPRLGTVGPALPGVETQISPDGEILIRGPGLMAGYLEDDAATQEILDGEGWLNTGDFGEIDEDGCLSITGRRKNLIVTATGKNVAPFKVESALATIPLVSHILVVGDGRGYLVALITLSSARMTDWAARNEILFDCVEKLRKDARIYRAVEAEIEKANQQLAPHERVRKFAILDSDFSEETGELTHDFKLRRRVVLKRYQDVIDTLYEDRY